MDGKRKTTVKLVKQPAQVYVLKLSCDCGDGDLTHRSSSDKGHLHRCTNEDCGYEIEINKIFPTTTVETIEIGIEDVILSSNEEKKEQE